MENETNNKTFLHLEVQRIDATDPTKIRRAIELILEEYKTDETIPRSTEQGFLVNFQRIVIDSFSIQNKTFLFDVYEILKDIISKDEFLNYPFAGDLSVKKGKRRFGTDLNFYLQMIEGYLGSSSATKQQAFLLEHKEAREFLKTLDIHIFPIFPEPGKEELFKQLKDHRFLLEYEDNGGFRPYPMDVEGWKNRMEKIGI